MTQIRTFKRREFLRIVAASSIAGVAAVKLGWDRTPSVEAVTETRLLMGTVINLTLVTDDRRAGQEAISACLDHMQGLEVVVSRHRADSQLSRLNGAGVLEGASSHLLHVLAESHRIAALTGGAFDVTIKPLVDLYQSSQSNGGTLPSADAIREALACVGYAGLIIEGDRISFERPGMAVTLDGIAKGYIVDEGIAILHAHGFTDTLVEAGGDLVGTGMTSNGAPWRIGIEPPREGGTRFLGTLDVANRAVATSGDYMQPYTQDFSLHHIIDPRTGYSAPTLASATVVADRCEVADALATALMVLGPEQGLAVLASIPGSDGYLVGKDSQVWKSEGFMVV